MNDEHQKKVDGIMDRLAAKGITPVEAWERFEAWFQKAKESGEFEPEARRPLTYQSVGGNRCCGAHPEFPENCVGFQKNDQGSCVHLVDRYFCGYGEKKDPGTETVSPKARCRKCGREFLVDKNGYCWPCRMPKPPDSFNDPRAPLWPAYLIGSCRESRVPMGLDGLPTEVRELDHRRGGMPIVETKPSVPETKEANPETTDDEKVWLGLKCLMTVAVGMPEVKERLARLERLVVGFAPGDPDRYHGEEKDELVDDVIAQADAKVAEVQKKLSEEEVKRELWRSKCQDVEAKLAEAKSSAEAMCRKCIGADTQLVVQRMNVRPEVAWFAQKMEATLREHDDKGGWGDCADSWLLERLRVEVDELAAEMAIPEDGRTRSVIKEATDVANYAMMLADVARKKK